jgi:hypothetical protein
MWFRSFARVGQLIPDQAEHLAKRTLRDTLTEMRPDCPEHCGDIFDRVCVDWYAAHDNDAPALLNLIEYPLKVMIERRVATMLQEDPAQREAYMADLKQHVFERCDVP